MWLEWSWWLPVLGFAFITCGTPGPNNLLLTAAGARRGWRGGLGLLLAVVTGLNLIMLAVVLGLGAVFIHWPGLQLGLRGVGSVYLLWLAMRLAVSGMPDTAGRDGLPSWYQAALLQWLNPKGWMMALSAIGGFTLGGGAYWASAVGVLTTFFLIGLLTGAGWLMFGAQVRHLIRSPLGWSRFNRLMGALTALCVLMMWW